MGRINNGNWVNQHRKIQGKFQNKQDIEAYLFDTKLSNGHNIQENRLNIDDLPNIPAILADEPNLSRQSIIEPIDGGKAHTPATQAFLTALTTLSVISPNMTASSKKYISTDSHNSLSHTVKSFTEVSATPVLLDTTSATTPTSQNHDKLEEPTKHNDNQSLIRVTRGAWDHLPPDHCLLVDGIRLDTELLERQLKENSNFTAVCLEVENLDSQTARDFATILKNSNINALLFTHRLSIEPDAKDLITALKYTNINVLTILPDYLSSIPIRGLSPKMLDYPSSTNSKYIQEVITCLKDTNVEKLILANNYIIDRDAIYIIKSLKEVDSKVKILDLTNNNISNKGAEDIASELRGTKIVAVQLQQNLDITPETLQTLSMVLEDNQHVNEDSYTATMESSTTKEESSKDISGKQKEQEDLITPKENIIEQSEPIASNSTTTTPKESNPNNPTSSTISNESSVVELIALAVSIIGAIGGAVVYATKKFYDGKKSYTHNDLPLVEPVLDSHLDNNQDIPLTGVVVEEGAPSS